MTDIIVFSQLLSTSADTFATLMSLWDEAGLAIRNMYRVK
jgi:hypothetical protein